MTMSLYPLIASDMWSGACRPTQSSGVTRATGHLWDPCPTERHSRPQPSPHSTDEHDMDAHACRCTHDGEATFTRVIRGAERQLSWAVQRRPGQSPSSEKLNAVSPYVIAPLSEITGMIVPAKTKAKVLAPFLQLGVTVTKAS